MAPVADRATGLTFSTEAGSPVPNGRPRGHDLVEIGGSKIKVAQAIRDGWIEDPSRAPSQVPSSAAERIAQVVPAVAPSASPEAAENAADMFTAEVIPRASPMATESLMADLAEGQFSERTMDYLMLEGGQSAEALECVRDAYAAKVTAATGMDEAELQDLWKSDRTTFNAAIAEMIRTGSTAAFQALAEKADAAAYQPLDTDAALNAWRSADFPQALVDAGIEPIFEGGELSINIPGKGVVAWSNAVSQGLVMVSRNN